MPSVRRTLAGVGVCNSGFGLGSRTKIRFWRSVSFFGPCKTVWAVLFSSSGSVPAPSCRRKYLWKKERTPSGKADWKHCWRNRFPEKSSPATPDEELLAPTLQRFLRMRLRCQSRTPEEGARLRGRTATQSSRKGSEKVLGRVLEKGSQKGSEKWSFHGFYSRKGF